MSELVEINGLSRSTSDVYVASDTRGPSFKNFNDLYVVIDNSGSGRLNLGQRTLFYEDAGHWNFESGSYAITGGTFESLMTFGAGVSATVTGGTGPDSFDFFGAYSRGAPINVFITDFDLASDRLQVSWGFGYEKEIGDAALLSSRTSITHLDSAQGPQTRIFFPNKAGTNGATVLLSGRYELDFIDERKHEYDFFIGEVRLLAIDITEPPTTPPPLSSPGRFPETTLKAPAGQSKIAFSQPVSSAVISQDSSGTWTVTLPGGSSNRLEGYKRVEFADKTVALDTEAVGGQAYRVYKAAFNREPDQGGLGYWIAQMDSGMNMVEVAARFIDSNEFRSLYGNNPSDAVFLTRVYQNVLGREPEPGGYNWWLNEMRTNPEKTRAKVLADFSESAENKVGVSSLISAGVVFQPYTSKEYRVVSRAAEVNESPLF